MRTGYDDIAAIVLAAGFSRRFPESNKLLQSFQGKPLVAHSVDMISKMSFGRKLAVVQDGQEALAGVFHDAGFEVVVNMDAEKGMGTSISAAIRTLAADNNSQAAMICLGDMPFVTEGHLKNIVAAYDGSNQHDAVCTGGEGYQSPPALFSRRCFDQLAALEGDVGARHLFAQSTKPLVVEQTNGAQTDINTAEDFLTNR